MLNFKHRSKKTSLFKIGHPVFDVITCHFGVKTYYFSLKNRQNMSKNNSF